MRMRRACKPNRHRPGKFMSYILDALKRAEAERERGAVPGLHARQMLTPTPHMAGRAQRRVWTGAGMVLGLAGMAAAGLWFWQKTPDAAVQVAAVQPVVASPVVPTPLASPASAPIPTPAPAPTPAPKPAPKPKPKLPAVAEEASRPQSATASTPREAAPSPVPAAVPAVSLPAAKSAAAERALAAKPPPPPKPDPIAKAPASQAAPAVRRLSDLPEEVRRQIPPLTITGSVYSANPEKRLLLVNNQVLAQGSLAAPEVTLVEIQAKSSVFSFRGTRFRVVY